MSYYGKTKGLKLWQVLVGVGVLVSGIVLVSRSSSGPAMPSGPAEQARRLCEHYIELAVNAGETVTREQQDQCYAQTLANIGALTPERYQCLMNAKNQDDFLNCARQWQDLGTAWGA